MAAAPMTISELVERIRRDSDQPVIGCAEAAVHALCASAPGPLPTDYLEWLRLAGHAPGDFMHQGYVHLWFHARGDLDRRVFRHLEGDRASTEVSPSFTAYLMRRPP